MTLQNAGFEMPWAGNRQALCATPGAAPVMVDTINMLGAPGWISWYVNNPDPAVKFEQPECHDTYGNTDRRRTRSGLRAMCMFASFRKWKGGYLQQVPSIPGHRYRLTGYAHGWARETNASPVCTSEGCWSEACGRQAGYMTVADLMNGAPLPANSIGTRDHWDAMAFKLGIDPTGGQDPLADDRIKWGSGALIYNAYHEVPPIEVVATGHRLTVFTFTRARWPYVNSDAYWDDIELVDLDEEPEEPPPSGGRSCWGIHFMRSSSGSTEAMQARPAVVKSIGDLGMLANAPAGVLTIGRAYLPYDALSQKNRGLTPLQAAQEVLNTMGGQIVANPHVMYWEGHNETVASTKEEMAWFAQHEIERTKLLWQSYGKRSVIGDFATGCPEILATGELWTPFIPACKAVRQYEAVLGLHEYSNPWMWWGVGKNQPAPSGNLPDDEGWLTLRYRQVYRKFLIPNDAVLPLVITECGLDGLAGTHMNPYAKGAWSQLCGFWAGTNGGNPPEPDCADYYFRQLAWYEQELCKDPYVIGFTLYCWGATSEWKHFDVAGTAVATKIIAKVKANPSKPFVYKDYLGDQQPPPPPDDTCQAPAREPYDKVMVLLHQNVGREWGVHAAIGGYRLRLDVTYAADEAGIGCNLKSKKVIIVNPALWQDNIVAFFQKYYPDAIPVLISPRTPAELTLMLQPKGGSVALSQRDPRWAALDMGEEPGGETIGAQGCLLTTFTMMLRAAGGFDIFPQITNDILRQDGRPFTSDNYLTYWDIAVKLFPTYFNESIKTNGAVTMSALKALLANGWLVGLMRSDGNHFVYLDSIPSGSTSQLTIIDPWYGDKRTWSLSQVGGIRAARLAGSTQPPPPPPTPSYPLRGIHDTGGGDWLIANKLKGWVVDSVYVGDNPLTLDYTKYEQAGIRVICRLNYSWARRDGGQGTLPGPTMLQHWLATATETLRRMKGQWAVIIANEYNNPSESYENTAITPEYYIAAYNALYGAKPVGMKMGPGAIDPTNAGWGDWRTVWPKMLVLLAGIDVMPLHCYTHGPELYRITHDLQFGDNPLKGAFYDMRMLESQIAVLPAVAAKAHKVVTETNHLFLAGTTVPGWEPNARDWVLQAESYLAKQPIIGYCLFRWSGTWGISDKPQILEAIK